MAAISADRPHSRRPLERRSGVPRRAERARRAASRAVSLSADDDARGVRVGPERADSRVPRRRLGRAASRIRVAPRPGHGHALRQPGDVGRGGSRCSSAAASTSIAARTRETSSSRGIGDRPPRVVIVARCPLREPGHECDRRTGACDPRKRAAGAPRAPAVGGCRRVLRAADERRGTVGDHSPLPRRVVAAAFAGGRQQHARPRRRSAGNGDPPRSSRVRATSTRSPRG